MLPWLFRLSGFSCGQSRKVNGKPAPLTNRAAYGDEAPVIAHDAQSCRQPQTSSPAWSLGGKERVKHFIEYLGRDASPCIGHRQEDVGTRPGIGVQAGVLLVEADVAGLKSQRAAVGMASRALTQRFISTWASCVASA